MTLLEKALAIKPKPKGETLTTEQKEVIEAWLNKKIDALQCAKAMGYESDNKAFHKRVSKHYFY